LTFFNQLFTLLDYLTLQGGTYNKLDLIKFIKDENRRSMKTTTTVVDMFFDEMANFLANGHRA